MDRARLEQVIAAGHGFGGWLVVDTDRGQREYLLGSSTQLDREPPVLDWRTSPLGEAFFRYRPGETYELELGDERVAAGRVVERWVIEPARLVAEDREVARSGDGVSERALPRPMPVQVPAVERSALPVLDAEQQAAVDLPLDMSLVLDGEAGVGKTLVALYRVAALARRARANSKRFHALVLVPTEGLRRLVRLLADKLGLLSGGELREAGARIEIAVFDDWLLERARSTFTGLPKRRSEGATAQVIGLKRHPAVRAVLDDFVDWKPPRGVDDEKISRTRQRLLHLWGDRERLARILEAAGGALPARAASAGSAGARSDAQRRAALIDAVTAHTRKQFETTTEKAFAHVDADRLVALDGRALDAGTTMEDAHTFDVEDLPVLFDLVRRGALPGPKEKLARYDHVVIDEAQLRAPLELAAIGDALTEHATVTLAGDHRQATDESAWFAGWEAARSELRRSRWSETTLAVTYRSVPAIATFARALVDRSSASLRDAARDRPAIATFARALVDRSSAPLRDAARLDEAEVCDGGRLPDEPPPDPAVWASRCGSALAQAAALCWHLDALITRDPWRQICVVARNPDHARRLHAELSRGLDPTLVLDGDFRFEPGLIVTTASAVSGLEFDAVVLPDLTPAIYPAAPELARTLYVAATRARDWLWVLTPDAWSPLVEPTPS